MSSQITVADFMESKAHLFSCGEKGSPTFATAEYESACRESLIALFSTSAQPLVAHGPGLTPLVPGHQYKVCPNEDQVYPDSILLENASPQQGVGKYAVSPMGFLNAFVDNRIPDIE